MLVGAPLNIGDALIYDSRPGRERASSPAARRPVVTFERFWAWRVSEVKLTRHTWKDSALGNGELRKLSPLCPLLEPQEAACMWFPQYTRRCVDFTEYDAGRFQNGRQTPCLASMQGRLSGLLSRCDCKTLGFLALYDLLACESFSGREACITLCAHPAPRGLQCR